MSDERTQTLITQTEEVVNCSQCGQPMAKHRFVKHFVFTCNNMEGCSLYGERQVTREIITPDSLPPLENPPLRSPTP